MDKNNTGNLTVQVGVRDASVKIVSAKPPTRHFESPATFTEESAFNGDALFKNIPLGQYDVHVEAKGYARTTIKRVPVSIPGPDPQGHFVKPHNAIRVNLEPIPNKVVLACEKYWGTWKADCSGFAKAVAQELGITLTGQANEMVDQIQRAPWKKLATGIEARDKADMGMFVVAGLKAAVNGHVAIVVPGPLAHGKYPTGYWGSLPPPHDPNRVGKKNTTLNYSWEKKDIDKVIYSFIPVNSARTS